MLDTLTADDALFPPLIRSADMGIALDRVAFAFDGLTAMYEVHGEHELAGQILILALDWPSPTATVRALGGWGELTDAVQDLYRSDESWPHLNS